MAGKGKQLVGLTLAFIVVGILGLVMGGYWGFQRGVSMILNESLTWNAKAARSYVATLKQFRAGQGDQAAELLEAHLDDQLILFDPAERYPGLTAETISEINRAIDESKEYRLGYARKSNRPFVDEMVRNLFSKDRLK
jgi:hypothetical protein